MSFLFVDRIITLDENPESRFIRGIKQVTHSDTYLCASLLGKKGPVLMSSIIGETLGQLGAWCAMKANDFRFRPVAGVVAAVHIHDEVEVGETLLLETTIDALDDVAVEYHSLASVNGRSIFTIEHALGPMLPMEDFIDPVEVRMQFERIFRISEGAVGATGWSPVQGCTTISVGAVPPWRPVDDQPVAPTKHLITHTNFDQILEWIPGERATAFKQVSLSAPYFSDHFPRKPVLPLTILLQAKLALAGQFLAESFDNGQDFKPVTIRRVKMSDFVQPGDSVVTQMQLKEKTENQAIFRFHTEMHDACTGQKKRVCMAEAVFEKRSTSIKI